MTTMTMSVHVYDYNGIVLHEMQPDICKLDRYSDTACYTSTMNDD